MFDIFLITEDLTKFSAFKAKYSSAKRASSLTDARKKAFTKMFWAVWDTTQVLSSFSFDYHVDAWDMSYIHVFKNTNGTAGICLVPKSVDVKPWEDTGIPQPAKYLDIKATAATQPPYDIVFISNGEQLAEEHWQALLQATKRFPNKVHRVSNITGRVAAYQAAARMSTTNTFFAVFAKIKVNPNFDWLWTGHSCEKKHYIFQAENPVNGLVYGHQAIIAYNKELVLRNDGGTIDFTLKQNHEVVNMLSGTAHYNTSEKSSWRTAFREALKLKLFADTNNDQDASQRLDCWLAPSEAPYGDWSQKGAHDAVEYYHAVGGDYNKLMLSFEWQWLDDYFSARYNLS